MSGSQFSRTVLVCLLVCLLGVHLFFPHSAHTSPIACVDLLPTTVHSVIHQPTACACVIVDYSVGVIVSLLIIFRTLMHALLGYLRWLYYYFRILTNCPRQCYVFSLATVCVLITLPGVDRTSYWDHLHLIRHALLFPLYLPNVPSICR